MARAQPLFAGAPRLPAEECVTLRPIRPRDAGALQAYIRGLSSESRYNRFFGALNELPPAELYRVTHLDRKYELALLAETQFNGGSIVIAEARYACSLDRLECEYALSVADDWHDKGLGMLLVTNLEGRARSIGARYLSADVLRSNEPMKALAHKTGFLMTDVPLDAKLVRIVKDLALSQGAGPPPVVTTSNLPIAA